MEVCNVRESKTRSTMNQNQTMKLKEVKDDHSEEIEQQRRQLAQTCESDKK